MTANDQNPILAFAEENAKTIATYKGDKALQEASNRWLDLAFRRRYMYHFGWLGRPVIQIPVDMVGTQELIWATKPDLILETGIAHGGSLIFSASMLALIDMCEAIEAGTVLDPAKTKRRVLGVDIDIRAHNRAAIEAHPMSHRIDMIQGSSLADSVINQVKAYAKDYKRIMVCLDSNHTHDHVMAELEAYAPLTTKGSYCIVFDTIVEDLAQDMFPDRPWKPGDNPKTAVWKYLEILNGEGRTAADGDALKLEIDRPFEDKLLLSVAPDGYLRRPG